MLYPTNLESVDVTDDNFPSFVTEYGDMILYCPDGRVFWNNTLVEFDNPTFNIDGIKYIFDAFQKAKDLQMDVLVYLEGTFELASKKHFPEFVMPKYWHLA